MDKQALLLIATEIADWCYEHGWHFLFLLVIFSMGATLNSIDTKAKEMYSSINELALDIQALRSEIESLNSAEANEWWLEK